MKFNKLFLTLFTLICTFAFSQSAQAVNYSFSLPVNPLSPSGTLTATSWTPPYLAVPINCEIITYNGTTCNASFTWTTANTGANSRVRLYDASVYTTPGYPDTATQQGQYLTSGYYPISSNTPALNGTNALLPIKYGVSTIELYDIRSNVGNQPDPNSNQWYLFKIATLQVRASCGPNMTWTGTGCQNTPITATITATPTSCTIASGSSTCPVDVSWTSNNYYYASVKQDGTEFSTALTQSTPVTRNISSGTHIFSYYGGIYPTTLFSTVNATASCASGSTWNGSICASATITSTPTCTILQNGNSCTVNVSWTSNGATSPSIKQDGTQFSTLANQSTPVSRTISNGSHAFTFYSGSTLLSTSNSVASCITNTAWNGTACVPSATADIISTPACTIAVNASTCPVNVTWTTSGSISNLGIYQGGTNFSSAPNQSTPVSRNITHGLNNFAVYGINGTNTILYDTSYSTGSCTSGTVWNGTICSSASITSDPSCTISANASDCSVGVTWISNSLVSPSIKQDGTQFSTLANQSTPVSRTIDYGSHNFTISDGSTVLGTANSVASCDYGSNWNGSICDPFPLAIITAEPICQILPNDSTCDVNVSWTSANLPQPSVYKDSTQISTSPSDTSMETIAYGMHVFTIYSKATSMDSSNSQAVCSPGSSWDGTVCAGAQSATISSDPTCTILASMNTCDVNVSWSSSSLSSPSVEQDTIQFSTSPNDTGTLKTITYGSHTFTISDGATVLGASSSGAWCIVGTSWDGASCVGVTGSLTATLTANPTKIASGSPSTLTWGSTGAVSCTGTGFNTSALTSGSVVVKPKVTTTYKVTCYDSSGAGAFQNAKVSVGKLKTIYSEGKTTTYIELQDRKQ